MPTHVATDKTSSVRHGEHGGRQGANQYAAGRVTGGLKDWACIDFRRDNAHDDGVQAVAAAASHTALKCVYTLYNENWCGDQVVGVVS